ncbi:hypothetical protein GH714_029384 [Hevea brasiliensis]|uniref:DNA 3'-5' helicase n=1 Tax=Hevea brasiliensis TaxID=3981 RepID=A0A6A6KWB3_HEVBR|nr:hypothetical protein GH714_029384 [Hevea brasiliensis]
MPPSPALRYSPGREPRAENHRRGHSLEGGLLFKEKDDDLALFNEMQSRERENFLLQSSDDFEDTFCNFLHQPLYCNPSILATKLRHFSDFKLGISIPVRGESSELLHADGEKNDYDWLLTPPETPLFPSLDDEPPAINIPSRGRPRSQPITISRSSTMENSYRSSRGSASPNRLSPSPRSCNSSIQSRGRPSSASHSSPTPSQRPASPSRRPSPSPQERDRTSSHSRGSVASSGDDDLDSVQSIHVGSLDRLASKTTDTFSNNRAVAFSKKSTRIISPSSAPKRSFGSALRQMDHRKSPQNMFRPLLSSVPSSTFYVAKANSAHRPLMSRNSSVAISSNASSDQGTSAAPDTDGNDHRLEYMVIESGKTRYSDAQEEVFAFDKKPAAECEPNDSEDFSHQQIDMEISSASDTLCVKADFSEVDSSKTQKFVLNVVAESRVIQEGDDVKHGQATCHEQSHTYFQESSQARSPVEGDEQRIASQHAAGQPAGSYMLPDNDSEAQQLLRSSDYQSLKVDVSEGAGISVLLKSLRSSFGHASTSASSSIDFSSGRQVETRVQRQLSGRKSDMENYRYDTKNRPQSAGSSLSGTSNHTHALGLATSTHEEKSEASVGDMKHDGIEGATLTSHGIVVSSEKKEMGVSNVSFTGAVVPEEGCTSGLSCQTVGIQLEENPVASIPTYEDCHLHGNKDDLLNNTISISDVEASIITPDPPVEMEHTMLNSSVDGRIDIGVTAHSSLVSISEIETENFCQSSLGSENDDVSTNSKSSINEFQDVSIPTSSGKEMSASVLEQSNSDHSHGILEDSTVKVQRGSMARSLTLEEATDTTLFCSSIVHDLAYRAATIAIEKEDSVCLEGSWPTVTVLGKSTADRKDSRSRTTGKRTSKSLKVRRKRMELDVKSPSTKTENDENANESMVDISEEHWRFVLVLLQLPHSCYFSKSASFSKIHRPSLNFESTENDTRPQISAGANSTDHVSQGNKPNSFKKHPNLIGANAPLPPAKLRKYSVSEGNFVKLNMNRNKRKFLNRKATSKNGYGSSGFKSYRRSKRKQKAERKSVCDANLEDGLISEIMEQKPKRGKGSEVIEEAVFAVQNEASDENLVKLLNVMYGYDSFRDGQLEAIKMVLDGKSTMLVLPTGAGKSLCYQIPAMLLPGITLVVSPLVALMIDQLKQLPPELQGGLLSSSQTSQEAAETLRLVKEAAIKVLFVSPERFLNAEFLPNFSAISISLLVVDEAHCILNAMTATATNTTLNAVMSALEISSANLIQKPHMRDNLQLSVSLSGNRMKDLLSLMKSSPFMEVQSIIIYCKFQSESDIVSRYLCDNNISSKSYHSAIPSKDRSQIQELFCSNKIRVVVATVAFGMGLDKRDVGAVIHYSLPESLEEYVQEIGRAGRDGRLSYCHLFFDDTTYCKLRSLLHSEGVDEYAVSKFLSYVFSNGKQGKICSIIRESASREFDMKEEVMLTLLTQLELGEVQYLHLLPELNVTCTLNFYKTTPVLLADKDIVVSAILKKSETKQGQHVFDVPTVANSIGFTTIDLSNHLQSLKLKGEITYEVNNPAYCYSIVKVPEDFCFLSAHLTRWLSEVERLKVQKLDAMFNAAVSAVNECEKMQGCNDSQHTPCLQRKILDYFREDGQYDISNQMRQSRLAKFLAFNRIS